MAKKKYLTTVGVIWLACLFLLGAIPEASADITASIRLNKLMYDQGEQVSVWITLSVTERVLTDDHFFQKKFERLLDVRNAFGNRIPPIIGDHDDALPIPPTKSNAWLETGDYEVKLLNLWDHYEDPGSVGAYSIQFVLSMTVYDDDGLHPQEKVVSSNIETFKIITQETVSISVHPDPLVLAKTPNWVTCYISDFPEGYPEDYGPGDVDIASVKLWNEVGDFVSPDWSDIQGDQLMIKFPGPETSAMMEPGKTTLTATGWLGEYIQFSGTYTIKVK